MCFDGGIDDSKIFLREEESAEGLTEYIFPTISLVPPYDDGCYVKLYHNGNVLKDTIYIPKNGPIQSHSKEWKIRTNNPLPNFYDFTIIQSSKSNESKGR